MSRLFRRCFCLPLLLLVGLGGCLMSPTTDPVAWTIWRGERRAVVAGTNGWTTIVGLFWLDEGRSSVGTAPGSSIRFEPDAAPPSLGYLIRRNGSVRYEPTAGISATIDHRAITSDVELTSDVPGPASILRVGRLELWVIVRGDRIGLRVRDHEALARRQFHGLEYFPWRSEWQVHGHFELHPAGKTVAITDVTGVTQFEANPGVLVFDYSGVQYRLEALTDPEAGDLFVLFKDTTNGETTYSPGRFMHVSLPDAAGRVVLDFNRAYNPPCAFTEFATCPRPPATNRLPFPVPVGERKYR